MLRTLRAAGILSIVLAAACGSSSTGPTPPADYAPVALGNQWDYQLVGSAYPTADQDTVEVTGTTVRAVTGEATHEEGFSLFIVRDITNRTIVMPDTVTQTDTTLVFFYLNETGLRIYDDTVTTHYELALKLPITQGDNWVPDSYEPTVTREVVSVSETVTVPAGTWQNCALLKDTDTANPDSEFEFILAPGIGPVVYSIVDVGDTMTMEMELSLTASVIN